MTPRLKIKVVVKSYTDEATPTNGPEVSVGNHWVESSKIHIRVGDAVAIVLARDLRNAIDAATVER